VDAKGLVVKVGDWFAERFLILAPRAAGTSGSVWLARERETDKACLLHELPIEPSSEALARLHVVVATRVVGAVPCLGLLEHEAGWVLVLEVAEGGQTLAELVHGDERVLRDRNRLVAALSLIDRMFGALALLHTSGQLHGGLAPRNLWLSEGAVQLLGLGLYEPPTLSGFAGQSGLWPYAAPERLKGHPVSVHTDAYSMAAIAFWLLTGRVPNQGSGTLETLERRVQLEAPLTSSLVAEATPCDAFFRKALAREPSERFADGPSLVSAWRALGAPLLSPHADKTPKTRAQQLAIIEAAAACLREDEELFPTEVVQVLSEQLLHRADRKTADEAWRTYADEPRVRVFVGKVSEGVIESLEALPCAKEDLLALELDRRRAVLAVLAELVLNPAPRGVEALGDAAGYLRLRAAELRVLYRVKDGAVTLVRLLPEREFSVDSPKPPAPDERLP
jgi:mRNA-degrading endonuclease RelE of RelBE toxin-antitoxin system